MPDGRQSGATTDVQGDPHVDDLIAEENRHLKKAVRAAKKGASAVAKEAVEHAEEQVDRAVTISQYEQILDAALRNMKPDEFFEEILTRVRTMMDAEEATIFLVDEEGKHLYPRASVGLEEAVQEAVKIPVGEGVTGVVLSTRESSTLKDVNEKTVSNPLLLKAGIKSLVTVPILVDEGPIGVLEVGWTARRRFDPQEVKLLEVVAERVALAIERTLHAPPETPHAATRRRLVEPMIEAEKTHLAALIKAIDSGDTAQLVKQATLHAENQTTAATTIGDYEAVRDAALGSVPMDERLALLLEGTRTLLASHVGAVLLMDDDGDQLWPRASIGFATSLGVKPVAVSGSIRKVVVTGEALLVGVIQADDRFRIGLAEEGIQSLIAVPIPIRGKVQGVLIVGHRTRDRFVQTDLELLQLVAGRMGIGLERDRVSEGQARETRHAKEASQFKTDLLHMATHDLKTPLLALNLQLHLMTVTQSEAERKKSLAVIKRNLARLTVMLDDFLDLARVEAGRMTIKPGKLKVDELVRDAIELFAAQAKAKKLKLEAKAVGALEAYGDERRIPQVMANLVSNAVRYSPPGGTIRLGATKTAEHVEIFVQDEGLGLSSEQISRLFRPFVQVQDVPEEAKGTGLGLYLSQAIVQAHGGRLRLDSPGPGKGTRAAFTLPRSKK